MKFSMLLRTSAVTAAMMLALAAPAFAADSVCTMATTDALRLRSGEGTKYSVIDVMPKGTSVEVYGMSKDGWYHVKYGDKTGYCYYKWLDFEGDAAGDVHDGKTTEMFPICGLNIREQPTTNSRILGSIAKDEAVAVTAKHDGWFSVEYNGIKGYCHGRYLSFTKGGYTADDSGDTAGKNVMNQNNSGGASSSVMNALTTTAPLNVRAQPSTSSKVIGSFAKGASVKLVEDAGNGWYKVEYGSGYGYCYGKYLR